MPQKELYAAMSYIYQAISRIFQRSKVKLLPSMLSVSRKSLYPTPVGAVNH